LKRTIDIVCFLFFVHALIYFIAFCKSPHPISRCEAAGERRKGE
jgi:hypothetical protein